MKEAMASIDILEPATLIGLGAVAVWVYVRYPRLRPRTLTRAIVHVAASCGLFALLPYAIGFFVEDMPKPLALRFVVALLIPTLTYTLFTWPGLLAKLHD